MKNVIFILSLLFFWGSIFAQCLIASYPFTGNANDVSANLLHGTIYGPSLATDRNGNPNSAYSFDGVNDSIAVPNLPNFGAGNYTVSYFIKTNSSANMILFMKGAGGCGYHNFWSSAINNGLIDASLCQDNSGSIYYFLLSKTRVDDNLWHHVAMVRSSAGLKLELYIDGVLDTFTTMPAAANINNTANLVIADYRCVGVDGRVGFNGLLDDINIYNCALSAQEIQGLFTSVKELENENMKFTVYPALANDRLRIDNFDTQIKKVEVYDISGKVVMTLESEFTGWLNVAELSKGIYFLKATTKTGQYSLAKFMKN